MLRPFLLLSAIIAGLAFGLPSATDALAVDGPPAAVAQPAAKSRCAVGEEKATFKGYDLCKPVGGACGKGRKHQPHHRYPDLIVCVEDKNAHAAELTCAERERPHYPANKRVKPFCEPVGRCGYGRVPVASEVPGKKMCLPK